MNNVLRRIFQAFSRPNGLYFIAKKIVDHHRNENNCDIETNGELCFIRKRGVDFKIIFDVGANIGEWTLLMSDVSPQAQIFAFEPSRDTYKTLQKNLENLTHVNAQNIGLADTNKMMEFYIYGKESVLNSSIKRELDKDFTVEQATFKKLDDFCTENDIDYIDFLKIDTEGNELSVLKGATNIITSGKVGVIQFEYGGTFISSRTLLKDMYEFFKDKPYEIGKLLPSGELLMTAYTEELENFQYANYIAQLKKK